MTDPAPRARILVVDRDPAARALIAARLVIEGHECVQVDNATQAESRLQSGKFDLVVCALHLPDKTGLELLKQVHESMIHLPFVICGSEDDARSATDCMKRGAADYLVKPVQLDLMAKSVEQALQSERTKIE